MKVGKSHTIPHGTQHLNRYNYFAPPKTLRYYYQGYRTHIRPRYTWIYLKPTWTGLLLATVTSGTPLSSQVQVAMPAAIAPVMPAMTPRNGGMANIPYPYVILGTKVKTPPAIVKTTTTFLSHLLPMTSSSYLGHNCATLDCGQARFHLRGGI